MGGCGGCGARKVWTFEALEKWGHVVEQDKLFILTFDKRAKNHKSVFIFSGHIHNTRIKVHMQMFWLDYQLFSHMTPHAHAFLNRFLYPLIFSFL